MSFACIGDIGMSMSIACVDICGNACVELHYNSGHFYWTPLFPSHVVFIWLSYDDQFVIVAIFGLA